MLSTSTYDKAKPLLLFCFYALDYVLEFSNDGCLVQPHKHSSLLHSFNHLLAVLIHRPADIQVRFSFCAEMWAWRAPKTRGKKTNRLHIMIVLYTCPQNGTKTRMAPGYPHMYLWRACLNHKYLFKMFCLHDPSHIQNVIIRIISKYLSNRLSIRFLNHTSALRGGCRRT